MSIIMLALEFGMLFLVLRMISTDIKKVFPKKDNNEKKES